MAFASISRWIACCLCSNSSTWSFNWETLSQFCIDVSTNFRPGSYGFWHFQCEVLELFIYYRTSCSDAICSSTEGPGFVSTSLANTRMLMWAWITQFTVLKPMFEVQKAKEKTNRQQLGFDQKSCLHSLKPSLQRLVLCPPNRPTALLHCSTVIMVICINTYLADLYKHWYTKGIC